MVAIAKARPEVDLPRHRPTGAAVAAQFERTHSGVEEGRRPCFGDLPARVQTEKVGDMAVLIIGIVPIN